jgi:hypothetical protein
MAKVRGEVFALVHAAAIRQHTSFQNWLFGLPGRTLCEQSLWCQKWWAFSWFFSSPLSTLSVCPEQSMPSHAFFPEHMSDNYQGLRRTSSEICTKFVRWDVSRLQMKELKESTRPLNCMKCCTLSPKICKYYHLQLHRATTTAVQTAEPIPEIMDTPS